MCLLPIAIQSTMAPLSSQIRTPLPPCDLCEPPLKDELGRASTFAFSKFGKCFDVLFVNAQDGSLVVAFRFKLFTDLVRTLKNKLSLSALTENNAGWEWVATVGYVVSVRGLRASWPG